MIVFWRILHSQTVRQSWSACVSSSFKENTLCGCLQIEYAFDAHKGRNSLLYYTNEIQRISADNTANFCVLMC